MKKNRRIGIVGVGPRGLHAFERFIISLIDNTTFNNVHFLLFEQTGNWGNGQVYDIDQVKTNWINISERILLIDERPELDTVKTRIPGFPSYRNWANKSLSDVKNNEPDTYPPRAKIGQYLQQRFESFVTPLVHAEIVTMIVEKVEDISVSSKNVIEIRTDLNIYRQIDELLLTIGHQPTELSEQLTEWQSLTDKHSNLMLFESPYPIKDFLSSTYLSSKSAIGIRGFGLAMIDVVRGIADKFGEFKLADATESKMQYIPFEDTRMTFIPFSLDGLPPVPKPLNAHIDAWFQPTDEQLSHFEERIANKRVQLEANSTEFLIHAITPVAAEIYSRLLSAAGEVEYSVSAIEYATTQWLNDDTFEHALITARNRTTEDSMEEFIGMATGKYRVSLDYCIGQVWRYCQPSIYDKLSYNECAEDVFAEILSLDDRMKRYAYGPPVESIQQMLALVSANMMTFDFVSDPNIQTSEYGWEFIVDGKSITAEVMINSVLESPKIKSVNSAIVKNLIANDLIRPVHDEYGISTDEKGYLIPNDDATVPIALLGRLAKGTIIGVDAILECFGSRPKEWALEAADRHSDWLEQNADHTRM